ncbi:hypothetical protein STEG23_031857 [Scotinomys teguina]
MGAQAPLRLPAAPPLAVCGYTSVLLLFAFCLPESGASNQPAGGGGDCPGGRGKSINCSGGSPNTKHLFSNVSHGFSKAFTLVFKLISVLNIRIVNKLCTIDITSIP